MGAIHTQYQTAMPDLLEVPGFQMQRSTPRPIVVLSVVAYARCLSLRQIEFVQGQLHITGERIEPRAVNLEFSLSNYPRSLRDSQQI
jgi:hypothetical protein